MASKIQFYSSCHLVVMKLDHDHKFAFLAMSPFEN